MPCQIEASVIDVEPIVNVTKELGLHLSAAVSVNIQCKKKENDTDYSQVFRINTEPLNLTAKLEIEEDKKLHFEVENFELLFKNVTDSAVDPVPTKSLNNIVGTFKNLVVDAINAFGKDGIAIQGILDKFNITFVNLDDTQLEPFDGYFVLMTNPVFKLDAFVKYASQFINS